MTSLEGKLTAMACHTNKKVNKAEELTYLSTNIGNTKNETPLKIRHLWAHKIVILLHRCLILAITLRTRKLTLLSYP